jgi:hypothetical protein
MYLYILTWTMMSVARLSRRAGTGAVISAVLRAGISAGPASVLCSTATRHCARGPCRPGSPFTMNLVR